METHLKHKSFIISFCIFASLVLFQTTAYRLGTITGLISILLLAITSITSKEFSFRKLKFDYATLALFLFVIIVTIVTIYYGDIPGTYYRFLAQVLITILVSNVDITEEENSIIKSVFCVACSIYAILIIRSCITTGSARFIHGDIYLFGGWFDPNFLGMPLVLACVLELINIFDGKKKMINLGLFALNAVAIVYTASRGNFLSLSVGIILVVIFYFLSANSKPWKKILLLILIITAGLVLFDYLSNNLVSQWSRMTLLNTEQDNGRFKIWESAFDLWKQNPIFGIGLGGMYRIRNIASHNTFIQVLVETGDVGVILFTVFYAHVLKNAYKYDKYLFAVILTLTIQILLLDCLDNRCFWIIMAWIAILPRKDCAKNHEDQTNN